MLFYKFDRIFQIRGINRPYTYLINQGFSTKLASKISNNNIARMDMKTLEKLCLILNCTPNDLLEWKPDSDVKENHPLYKLQVDNNVNMVETLNAIPLDKMQEINAMIRAKIESEE